ncbi:Sensor histidine kinase RcsC [Caprobacter fermentans]|uniref:histidine kinase n=1 Tax=Caproicibacter fermentans TaxID=2576756 RepID=A0A6N8HWX3_9FIRM|nr:HAMP domain-containing sensor histidine kinase [Caproicibacter fermentans]MVB10179.1 Sensor histidine kinase RcsC [Caproicibacter fermentans]
MKIFTKTFFYTLTLLILIALLADGLIYALLPKVYTDQKQQELTLQTDRFVSRLEKAKRSDVTDLMAGYAGSLQANLELSIGSDSYTMLNWDGGVITRIKDSDSEESGAAASRGTASESCDTDKTVTVTEDKGVKIISDDTASSSAEASGTENIGDGGILTGIVTSGAAGSKTIQAQRSFTIGGEAGALTATLTLAPVEEAVQVIVSLLPVSIFLCLIIAVLFSLLYARAITRPIKAISEETQRMNTLDRAAICRVNTRDEIGTLAANVNSLYGNLLGTIESLETELKKVGAAERAKTDFLRAASHELKTPVTAVSVIMDNMILGVGKYKNQKEWLPKCKELVDRLSGMLREILDTSHLGDAIEEKVTESIETICAEVIEPYGMIARAKGLLLYVDWSAAFVVMMPPKLLGKALSNILSNAVQYTATGGRLAVYCRGNSLFVENECAPISEEQIPRLFEPFCRMDESRSRETGGNGLGLYITASILHQLELDFNFKPMCSPDGMRFTIKF